MVSTGNVISVESERFSFADDELDDAIMELLDFAVEALDFAVEELLDMSASQRMFLQV